VFLISHQNMSGEVVHFSSKPCQKFQRNVILLLLVWNCQLLRDSCGTFVTQLSGILHKFASPLSSWRDSCFTIICVCQPWSCCLVVVFVCVECGLPLDGKSWI
jgi:hypothetical protein